MPVELLGAKLTDPWAPGSTNASSTEAAPSLAETRLPARGAQRDTKHPTGELRGPPRFVYYQDVLAAAGRCTEARACGL